MSDGNISAKTAAQEAAVGTEYAFHPIANLFPLLEGGEFSALVEDVGARGLNESIVLFEGMILDGRNRYRACTVAGIEARYREINFGSYAEARAYVISANIHRRHLTVEQRRELVEKLLKADPEQSDRQIAQIAKVSDKTVGATRRQAEARAEIPHVKRRIDSKGRKQPAHKTAPAKSNDSITEKANVTAGNNVDTEKSAEERRAYYAGNDADHPNGQNGAGDEDENYDRALKELIDAFERVFASVEDEDNRNSLSTDFDRWLRDNYWRVVQRQAAPPRLDRNGRKIKDSIRRRGE
jgi:hypothetical protein